MKPLRLQSAIVVLISALGIFGCSQKKPVLVAPQQPPPTTAPQPTPTPEPAVAEQPQPAQPPATPEDQTTAATKSKPKNTKITKRPAAKKPTPPVTSNDKSGTEVAKNTPPKQVIHADKDDTPTSGQISPVPTPADATHNQISTEQLLQTAEGNLNRIKRQLSKDEEAMRTQIREFIVQSHKATAENDLARAHNLAVKASLLSDELVKQR